MFVRQTITDASGLKLSGDATLEDSIGGSWPK
jgi:hypothetical protein